MPWIKRNLLLVISGVIALALLGGGGWWLYSAIQANDKVDAEIGSTKAELERLLAEKPFPSASNINQSRRELQRVKEVALEAKKMFPAAPATGPLNILSFKVLLQSNVDELNLEARASGVKIENKSIPQGFTNYYYSFEAQRLPMNIPPQTLHPLAEHLRDIKTIVSILFKAKINTLEAVRRSPVEGEPMGGPDYLPESPRFRADTTGAGSGPGGAENGVLIVPYEFTFHSFSSELAAVMEELARTPEAWVVRSVFVEPAEPVLKPAAAPPPVAPGQQPPGNPRARPAAPVVTTVLEEHVLKIVLKLDVIRAAKER